MGCLRGVARRTNHQADVPQERCQVCSQASCTGTGQEQTDCQGTVKDKTAVNQLDIKAAGTVAGQIGVSRGSWLRVFMYAYLCGDRMHGCPNKSPTPPTDADMEGGVCLLGP